MGSPSDVRRAGARGERDLLPADVVVLPADVQLVRLSAVHQGASGELAFGVRGVAPPRILADAAGDRLDAAARAARRARPDRRLGLSGGLGGGRDRAARRHRCFRRWRTTAAAWRSPSPRSSRRSGWPSSTTSATRPASTPRPLHPDARLLGAALVACAVVWAAQVVVDPVAPESDGRDRAHGGSDRASGSSRRRSPTLFVFAVLASAALARVGA